MSIVARVILTLLVLLLAAVPPAAATKETVALLPITTPGRLENAQLVMKALQASLERRGLSVVPSDKVEESLRRQRIELKAGVALRELGGLRSDLGADYVIYARILTEGIHQLTPARDLVLTFRSNILLNAVGTSNTDFLHTYEIGQVFAPGDGGQTPLMVKADADEAAVRLLEGFYSRRRALKKVSHD